MANTNANVKKLPGGATETAVDLAARMIDEQLAVCPFEGVLVFKNSASSYTTYPNTAEVQALIAASGSVEEAPVDGITYGRKDGVWVQVASTSEVDSKKALWKGYENPDDMHIDLITGDASRTYTVYRGDTTDTVFRCKGVEFSFPTGDPKLSVTLPAVARKYYLYHDDTGQLTYETVTTSDDVVKNNTLAPIIILDTPDAGATWMEISSINRWEDVRSNEIENYASYKTKTLVSTDNQVLFTGVLNGTKVGHGGGTYFSSRDFEFNCFTEDIATKVWAKYYLLGIDVDGIVKEQRFEPLAADGVPYYSTGGALQYNFFNTGTGLWEVQPVGNNDFVCCHFLIANGELGQVTTVLGQEDYGTLSQARNGIETEQENLVVSSEIFKEAGIRASCIFKNNAGVGELQYVDTGGVNLFKYILSGVLTGGAPSANLQNLISVLTVTPAGDAGGLSITNLKDLSSNTNGASPYAYGAIGDGVTDDTTAVQACFSSNTVVNLEGGVFLCSGITMQNGTKVSGGKLIGLGGQTVILNGSPLSTFENVEFQTTGIQTALYFDFTALTITDIDLNYFRVDGCSFKLCYNGVSVSDTTGMAGGVITNNHFYGIENNAVLIGALGEYISVSVNIFSECRRAVYDLGGNANISDNQITGATPTEDLFAWSSTSQGIYIASGSNDAHGTIGDNNINHCKGGGLIVEDILVKTMEISTNHFIDSDIVIGVAALQFVNNRFTSSTFSFTGTVGTVFLQSVLDATPTITYIGTCDVSWKGIMTTAGLVPTMPATTVVNGSVINNGGLMPIINGVDLLAITGNSNFYSSGAVNTPAGASSASGYVRSEIVSATIRKLEYQPFNTSQVWKNTDPSTGTYLGWTQI